MTLGKQFDPIKHSDLSPSGQEPGRSRAVSHEEFQSIAAKGHADLEKMRSKTNDISALHSNYGDVKSHAYENSREPWGGGTYNPRTAAPVNFHMPDKHTLSVRDPGQETVTVHANASREKFNQAMDTAKDRFGKNLTHGSHYLGVFHDADKKQIEIDPVVVVGDPSGKHRQEVGHARAESIGAATRATGGAYHFASGNGVFPPHVADVD